MTSGGDTKRCGRCDQDLPLEAFAWKNRTTGTRHSICKGCHNLRGTAYYEDTADRRRAQIHERRQQIATEAQAWLAEQRTGMTCAECGSAENLRTVGVRDAEGMSLSRMVHEGYSLAHIQEVFTSAAVEGRLLCRPCAGKFARALPRPLPDRAAG